MTNGQTPQHDNTPASRWRTIVPAGLGTIVIVLGVMVNLGSAPAVLLTNILLVALIGAALMHTEQRPLAGWLPWLASGALLGAAFITVLRVAPWPLAAALAFTVAGFLDTRDPRPRLVTRAGLFLAAAAANAILLWSLMFGDHMPVSPTEFASRNLRQSELLADVPLYDVWVAHLRGGPRALTMEDVRWELVNGFRNNLTPAFIAAAGVRELLGSLFEWDHERCHADDASLVHQLTQADRDRSLTQPGDSMFVYTFEDEALMEISNCTVHAFIGIALEPVEDGYDLYWAFYVKPVGSITHFYMALIQPFRHTIIYPPLIEGVERDWAERWAS